MRPKPHLLQLLLGHLQRARPTLQHIHHVQRLCRKFSDASHLSSGVVFRTSGGGRVVPAGGVVWQSLGVGLHGFPKSGAVDAVPGNTTGDSVSPRILSERIQIEQLKDIENLQFSGKVHLNYTRELSKQHRVKRTPHGIQTEEAQPLKLTRVRYEKMKPVLRRKGSTGENY